MNKMKELAQLLDVELGEEFELDGFEEAKDKKFKLTYNSGLVYTDGWTYKSDSCVLERILLGCAEIKRPLLKSDEKDYIEDVIRPFKEDILGIAKITVGECETHERICIVMKNDSSINLPSFRTNAMYTRFKTDKMYSLEELGLLDD